MYYDKICFSVSVLASDGSGAKEKLKDVIHFFHNEIINSKIDVLYSYDNLFKKSVNCH